MIIAVTGGLGTGKSTVSKIFAAALDADFVDTDQLCRMQMEPGAEGFAEFSRIFGARFVRDDGAVDRPLLRRAVFDDERLRIKLENILHPIVRRQVITLGKQCALRKKNLLVEVPLLYEVGWQGDFDVCVVVYVPESLCVHRVMEREGITVEEVEGIFRAQLPIEQKLEQAHFIVDNSGLFVSTVLQINWLSRKLK